jgi:hypothetical protein
VSNFGDLTLTNCRVTGNTVTGNIAFGGGIWNSARGNLTRSVRKPITTKLWRRARTRRSAVGGSTMTAL